MNRKEGDQMSIRRALLLAALLAVAVLAAAVGNASARRFEFSEQQSASSRLPKLR
jgi:photosystem II stability/assembly factor-like uncharacterized protein